jgi:two-component system invasion response regulator UvrY
VRILLVDDHAVVRGGLQRVLAERYPAAEFAQASTAAAGLSRVTLEAWSLVILDLSMPGRGGLDVLKEMREAAPGLPVLVMTMHAEEQYALRAFRAGASGYLTKGSAEEELLAAVEKILSGGKYVTAALAEVLAGAVGGARPRPHEELSDREFQVLRMIGAGRTVKQIGTELHLSEKTISTYRTRMLEKLKLETTSELVRYAIVNGLVD